MSHEDLAGGGGWIHWTFRGARRLAVAILGGTIIAIGVAMLVLPGPALIVIPAGLAILGLEFAWARRWLRHVRDRAEGALARTAGSGAGRPPDSPAGTHRVDEHADGARETSIDGSDR